MAVTETLQGLGSWGLVLSEAPAELVDKLAYFGHIAIHTGRVDYRVMGDAALTSSRYTGVLRKKKLNDDTLEIGGPGMAMWLGDEDQKGENIETAITLTAQTFENSIRAVLPDAVTEGTLFNIGMNFTGKLQFMSPRQAVDYICSTLGAEWIVRGDARIDAGLESDLFVTTPKTIVARDVAGPDMSTKGFVGNATTDQDVEDFTTRVVLLANSQDEGSVIPPGGTANINPGINPYKDLHGNFVKMTRFVSETSTDTSNAPARAQLQLNRFSDTRDAMTLDSDEYDIKGDLVVGDYMWVHDPEIGLVDGNNEKIFRGKRINPMKLRLTELTWPVVGKFSVGFRDWAGVWYNLTDYIRPEPGSSTLVVGGYNRSLTSGGADGGAGTGPPLPNLTIPGVPTWVTPFIQTAYQSPVNGDTRAQSQLKWTRPNNTDASTITDGDHYEIRYRTSTTPIFPTTWAQLAGYTWKALNDAGATWKDPITYPAGPWTMIVAPFTDLTILLQELVPNMPYEAQIRAVDGAVPPNYGAWSSTTVWQTSGDTIPPQTPAPPEVAASRISVQVVHRLGVAAGGTYNLDADMHHFDVHGSDNAAFYPNDDNLLGKISANNSMILGQVPAVGTIQIETVFPTWFKVVAVDTAGNKSEPSAAVQQTALLIDNAHISDLTVSKVTAGTITADWLVGARIATAFSGTRVEMNPLGIKAYNAAGVNTLNVDASTGNVDTVGSLKSGVAGTRVEVNPLVGNYLPEIRMYPSSGSTFAVINSVNVGNVAGIGINSGSTDGTVQSTMFCSPTVAFIGRATVGGPSPARGGFFNGDDDNGRMGYFLLPSTEAFINIGFDRHIFFKGVIHEGNLVGSQQAIFVGHADFDAFTTPFFGFGATMFNGVSVVASFAKFANSFQADIATVVYNLSNTGVTVSTNHPGGSPPTGRFSVWMWQFP